MLSSEQTSTAKRNTVVISDIFRLPKISTAFDSKRMAFIAKPAVSKDERSRRRMPLCASAKKRRGSDAQKYDNTGSADDDVPIRLQQQKPPVNGKQRKYNRRKPFDPNSSASGL